nr:HalOD1 output domain-containing protein [Halomarina oriensis]
MTASFDPSADRPSVAVVRAVAVATNASPTTMTPLAATLDPDALDAVFRETAETTVRFRYGGFRVVVTGSGTVRLSAEQ